MHNLPAMPGRPPIPPSPPWAPLLRASNGEPEALHEICRADAGTLDSMESEGRRLYGAFGLSREELAAGLARLLVLAMRAAERKSPGQPPASPEIFASLICPADAYFAEALVLGRGEAWRLFDGILHRVVGQVGHRFRGKSSSRILDEMREETMGLFYLDGKVATFRATAPIEAWARQVVFNQWRRAVSREGPGRKILSLSQGPGEESTPSETIPDPRIPPPDQRLDQREWAAALARAIPEALASLDRDERRMVEELPAKLISQVELAAQLRVSPFKLSRWYKEVRARFLKALTRELRQELPIDEAELDHLLRYLAGLWRRGSPG